MSHTAVHQPIRTPPCRLIGLLLLPYEYQRSFCRDFVALGHTVAIRRDRNGSRKISIDGGREKNTRDAMAFIEKVLFPKPKKARRS